MQMHISNMAPELRPSLSSTPSAFSLGVAYSASMHAVFPAEQGQRNRPNQNTKDSLQTFGYEDSAMHWRKGQAFRDTHAASPRSLLWQSARP
eukprot:SAG31_NODE_6987_length_1826_cov_2.045165_1_plen_92_part_00